MMMLRKHTTALLLYGVVVIVMTWPLVTNPFGMHLTRQFDIYATIWLAALAPDLALNLHTDMAGWPVGLTLNRIDSWIFFVVAKALGPIDDGRIALAFVTLLGPVLSAWAAERFAANCLRIARPWSLVAGLIFGFSGVALTALLEGHVYLLFNPWLPLMAWAIWRGTEADARWTHGLAAGVMWFCCLATSAYVGIAATFIGVGLLVRGVWMKRVHWPAAGTAAAISALSGGLYVRLFLKSGAAERVDTVTAMPNEIVMGMGSATAASLMGWIPYMDQHRHSISPILGATLIALIVFAPVVLRRETGWRTLYGLGLVAIILSFGPKLQLVTNQIAVPWVMWPFHDLPGVSFFRFPYRLLMVAALCMGAVAALVMARLAQRTPRASIVLILCIILDIVLLSGATRRTAHVPMDTPTIYAAAPTDRAILEIYPRFSGSNLDWELYINDLCCSYQREHQRPLLNLCVETAIHQGPRWVVANWLINAALDATPAEPTTEAAPKQQNAVATLSELGIGAVVVHPDLFNTEHRTPLLDWLSNTLGPPTATDTQNGEFVVLYSVPDLTPDHPRAAKQVKANETYAALAAIYK